MHDKPENLAELRSLGARSVPVIARGKQWVHALAINNIIAFLELGDKQEPQLPPPVLLERLDVILQAAQRYTRQFSQSQLACRLPGRDRSYRVLLHHIFRIPEAFLESAAGAALSYESLVMPPPAAMQTSDAIAGYGAAVRHRLGLWSQTVHAADWQLIIDTYYGGQTLHELLERTTWHSGQHVRQIMMVLDRLGIEPDRRLADATFADLPMPEKVWDD